MIRSPPSFPSLDGAEGTLDRWPTSSYLWHLKDTMTTVRYPMPRISHAAAATLLAVAACSARAPKRESSAVPLIASLSPDTVVVRDGEPVELTIRGSAFSADSNAITLGPMTITGIKAVEGGTIIRLTVPDRVSRPGAESPPETWVAGPYDVVVSNVRGRSAPVTVVIRGRG